MAGKKKRKLISENPLIFFNKEVNYHPSWTELIERQEIRSELEEVAGKIRSSVKGRLNLITPPERKILRFLLRNLDEVKVVIAGQDPYPQPGAATGRSFEIFGLHSWTEPFPQSSLKNLVRAVYRARTGKIETFGEIRKKISERRFHILPPGEIFDHWEKQGVLFVNTAYTCQAGKPGSHSEFWKKFSKSVMEYIVKKRKARWLLLGSHAALLAKDLPVMEKMVCHHPSRSYKRKGDLVYKEINVLRKLEKEIDWTGE